MIDPLVFQRGYVYSLVIIAGFNRDKAMPLGLMFFRRNEF